MLGSISGVDLIAKEFQKHETYYREYTRPIVVENIDNERTERVYQQGDFKEVCNVVNDQTIGQMKCISLQSLLQIYGPVTWSKQYRYKLKTRLIEIYGDQILSRVLEYLQ